MQNTPTCPAFDNEDSTYNCGPDNGADRNADGVDRDEKSQD
ncbi:hypothetical protein BN903_7 [Halorubrum sp. AJ67]|nr:hypothetical protein BN903_7 [Halorubrum sp. AJ67]